MKTIKKIKIVNFQCHKNTEINPAETGLTVITGPTDHGKSAVVRALHWLFYNRPLGDDFIRHGQNECKVSVKMENKLTVMRRRTASLNQYWINDECFEGFGNEVPKEVQQALGVYSYDVADETLNLNIAQQLSGPFLGSSITAPTRAKILGKLAGTETIDKANQELGTDIYRAKQKKKDIENDIAKKKSVIDDYSWVEPLGEKIKNAESVLEKVKNKKNRLSSLKSIKKRLDKIKEQKIKLLNYLIKLENLEEAAQIIEFVSSALDRLQQLKKIKAKLNKIYSKKEKLNKLLAKFPSNLGIIKNKTESLDIKLQNKNRLEKLFSELDQLYRQKQKLNKKLSRLEDLNKSKGIYHRLNNHRQKLNRLKKINRKLNLISHKTKKLDKLLNKLNKINKAEKIIGQTKIKFNQLTELKKKKKLISEIKEAIKLKHEKIKKAADQAESARKEYVNVLNETDICPTCGAKSQEHNFERVI